VLTALLAALPVVTAAAAGVVGGNSGAYRFDAARNRTISMHPAIMRPALGEVYGATELARELGLEMTSAAAGSGAPAVDAPAAGQ
jgi:hypothetical protein